MMLQYSVYSVISPEGCASILWRDGSKAEQAAESMGITADKLEGLGLVDEVLAEPLGGAHRDLEAMVQSLTNALSHHLDQVKNKSTEELLQERFARLESFGRFREG